MAMTRTPEFYDLMAVGLTNLGYTSFQEWIDDNFAEKYNAEKTFAQMGFPLNPNLPIRPTYEQLDATIRPYTMAAYVDIDSDGPTKSTDGLSLRMGELPIFKHEFTVDRKIIRDQLYLADRLNSVTPDIAQVAIDQFFITTDNLLGGNYNTFRYQRHQIVSTGKLVINAANNPLGIPLSIDFNIPAKNRLTKAAFSVDSTGKVTEKANANLVKDLKEVRENARKKDFCPEGHWEVSYNTWQHIYNLPSLRAMFVAVRNTLVDSGTRALLEGLVEEQAFKTWFEGVIGAKVEVIDFIGFVEKFNPKTKKMEYAECPGFEEGVMVYVPNGAIGDSQFGKPIFMQTPGARTALHDGGRTLIRQVFADETMVNTVKSECQGLIVPNRTRWMYYVTIQD